VGLADKTSISEVAINAGLAEALSASGGKVDPSLAAVEVAARFLADRPDEIGEAAGALLGISKVTGTTDARVNLGLLTRIGELGRVVNPKLQAENIAPALVGAAQFGGTASGAGALFAALSNAAEDKEGRRTGTALIQLARQLDDFQLGEGFEKFQGQFDRANLTQRIGFLQRNKKAAEQFLDKASFETKLVGPITGLLLDPNTSNAAKEFARFRALIPGNDDLASVGEDALNVFSANDLDSRAAAQRGLKRSIEAFELIDRDSVSQEEREILQDLLARTGSTVVGAKVDNFLAGLGDGSPGLDRKELVRLLRNRRDKLGVDTFAGLQIPELDGSKPNITPEEQRQVDILTQLIEVLERVTPKTEDGSSQLDESKKQTELLEQIAAKEGGLVGVAE
jgi:hypothetical protein